MLRRCYSKDWLTQFPTYEGCKVCPAWLTFSTFKSWMVEQDWVGKELDKDILGDGKIYSPASCCFVPGWLNKIFTDHESARGDLPIGVTLHASGMFQSRLRVSGQQVTVGYFHSPEDAHGAYLVAKRKYVKEKMKGYPDVAVRRAVLEKIK